MIIWFQRLTEALNLQVVNFMASHNQGEALGLPRLISPVGS
jgi:hypothetical protein